VAVARKDYRTVETEARAAGNAAGAVLLARVLVEQGKLVEALQLIDATQPVESRDSVRGDILARMERYPEAIASFRASIATFPHDLTAYANLAIVYALQNRVTDARAAVDEMLRNNHTSEAGKLAAKTRKELQL
jgi:Flp pilus assembly protein TadD